MTPHQRQIAVTLIKLWAQWTQTTPEAIYAQLYPRFQAVYGIELPVVDERLLDIEDSEGMWPQVLIIIAEQIDELTRLQERSPLNRLLRSES